MTIRFGMIVLYVRDLDKSIAFYRLLGLDVPEPRPDRPVTQIPLGSGISFLLTTAEIATRVDADWRRPSDGYQQVIEFFVGDDAAVDETWQRMTAAGYVGRAAPANPLQPYATLIEDPDGNVVMITHDPAVAAAS
ncbi:VOC family protein [Schumannella luteola]|uniref:Catechol 2,3-dioxygenase-like lactoylglutathione lyase family enzyme n=1 Tax=Schumannella luteola TaxID=472059 RepID=A0A852YD18_9MICO|nr:VOC family protein [Schumannella luteola]NYH00424.1 catechol 2,3-dioxygenase-like lactoylglutathione lyase family enzyme [Schumannella luteola]TPX03664.1 glyoxalase [Schumannella luteola]